MKELVSFAELLRWYRRQRGWTHEELERRTANERIGSVKVRTLSDLERGISRTARRGTVQLLADAFELADHERQLFVRAAQGERVPRPASVPPPYNLPYPSTSFVGREREVAALRTWLALPSAMGADDESGLTATRDHFRPRLVTIVGVGGCGKTKLAEFVAWHLLPDYPDGVWMVELATSTDATAMLLAIAQVLELRDLRGADSIEGLARSIGTRRMLLLLDNCEHLVDACAALTTTLLARCPHLRILATSRRALRCAGEQRWLLSPLPLPSLQQRPDVEAARKSEAVQLFSERARLGNPHFELTEANVGTVIEICRRIDGLPLAIELVAARLASLGLDTIATRLDLSFMTLHEGDRRVALRQRTMRAALDWSHALLPPAERVLFRRLAPFAGSFTVDGVEAICGDVVGDLAAGAGYVPESAAVGGLTRDAFVALLTGLVEHSLLVAEDLLHGARRYRLLGIIREYAREQLDICPQDRVIWKRHCLWLLGLIERIPAPLDGGDRVEPWLAELDGEVDNLRSALAWARDHDSDLGLRLIGRLAPYWFIRLNHAEGRGWAIAMLAAAPNSSPWRALALFGAGILALFDQPPAAHANLEEALALAEADGDAELAVTIRGPLAFACLTSGAPSDAARHLAAGWEHVAHDGRPGRRSLYRMLRGYAALARGALRDGLAELSAAYDEAVAAGQALYQCMILARLGGTQLHCGDSQRAIAAFSTLQRTAEGLGSWFYRYVARQRLGMVHEWRGDLDLAATHYAAALALSGELGRNSLERAVDLLSQGRLAYYHGAVSLAMSLFAACQDVLLSMQHRPLQRELSYWRGRTLWRDGQRHLAVQCLGEALALGVGGDAAGLALMLEGLGAIFVEGRDFSHAAQLFGGAAKVRSANGIVRSQVEELGYQATIATLVEELGESGVAAASEDGRAHETAALITRAREWLGVL